jgi:hypothetical protein
MCVGIKLSVREKRSQLRADQQSAANFNLVLMRKMKFDIILLVRSMITYGLRIEKKGFGPFSLLHASARVTLRMYNNELLLRLGKLNLNKFSCKRRPSCAAACLLLFAEKRKQPLGSTFY